MNIPLTGFLLVLILIYAGGPAAPKRLYKSFIAFMTAFLVWLVCAANSRQYLLDAPVLWRFLMQLSEYLLPLLANIVIFQVVDRKGKWLMRWTVLAYALLLAGVLVAEFMGFNGMSRGLALFYVLLPLVELVALYAIVRSVHYGNMYAKAVSVPLVFMAGAGTIDGLSMYRHWYVMEGYILPYTTLSLCVFAAFIVRNQIKRERMLMTREKGLKQEVTQAIEKATTDNLTKCYNRNKLEVVLATEILQHKSEEEPFSLVMMDIDFFKRINDNYGHEAGDIVLITVSDIIRQNVGGGGIVCRWGGEEILMILNESLESATEVTDRIRKRIDENIVNHEGNQIHVSMTFGVAESIPGYKIEHLIQQADDRLYYGKKHGKNQVVTSIPEG
jgi:diguanylate cyclase (GGDEF)-like protein